MTIAQTILDQLGGSRFRAMTGARDFVATGDGLAFRMPGDMATNKATHVRVTLTPADLYRVEFLRWSARRLQCDTVSTHDDVQADKLRDLFAAQTGLAVHL